MNLLIYSDGAIKNGGNRDGTGNIYGGIGGVIYQDNEEYLRYHDSYTSDNNSKTIVTNNRMELLAILEGLNVATDIAKEIDVKEIIVRSDSAYCINGINKHYKNWIKRNWKTLEGTPIKNKLLWKLLIEITTFIRGERIILKFEKVKGHSGDEGNEIADEMARKGVEESLIKIGNE